MKKVQIKTMKNTKQKSKTPKKLGFSNKYISGEIPYKKNWNQIKPAHPYTDKYYNRELEANKLKIQKIKVFSNFHKNKRRNLTRTGLEKSYFNNKEVFNILGIKPNLNSSVSYLPLRKHGLHETQIHGLHKIIEQYKLNQKLLLEKTKQKEEKRKRLKSIIYSSKKKNIAIPLAASLKKGKRTHS